MKAWLPALAPLCLLSASCVQPLPVLSSPSYPPKLNPPPTLTNFRKWHRATNRAYPMDDVVSGLCIGTPAQHDFWRRVEASHGDDYEKSIHSRQDNTRNFVHVYVNEIGRKSMVLNGPPFPVGSVIVKEKFPQLKKQPALDYTKLPRTILLDKSTVLTVMRKRESGFDPKNGDWEYFTGDPNTLILTAPDAKTFKTCQSCHALYKDRDYVSKVYLITRDDQVTRLPKR